MEEPADLELKFDGEPVRKLDGAPADAVISSLAALQRMVLIIGMRSEGYALGQRFKPSARIKREYSVVCRAPQEGSHIQPFNVAAQSGAFTPAAARARDKLLRALKAVDSEDEQRGMEALPDPRERWFIADAAKGLLPAEDSGLQITVRPGSHGPCAFKADRARALIQHYRSGTPPQPEGETVLGKLHTIDYARTIITLKPSNSRAVRFDYPLKLEDWFQANVRRRIQIVGDPVINEVGDITSFRKIHTLSELEPTLPPIEEFRVNGKILRSMKPLAIPATLEFEQRLFSYEDDELGINTYSETYEGLREAVLSELEVLWRQYADAPDEELASDAQSVKHALRSRFKVAER